MVHPLENPFKSRGKIGNITRCNTPLPLIAGIQVATACGMSCPCIVVGPALQASRLSTLQPFNDYLTFGGPQSFPRYLDVLGGQNSSAGPALQRRLSARGFVTPYTPANEPRPRSPLYCQFDQRTETFSMASTRTRRICS